MTSVLLALALSGLPQDPAEGTVRSVWNLTFLEGQVSDPTSERSLNAASTGRLGVNATALAASLSTAYSDQPPGSSRTAAENRPSRAKVTAVGNSLVIEGNAREVYEVRRLLATQIDIAQSQVLLELDTYQVTSTRKTADENNQAAKKLLAGQAIARGYKAAYLNALAGTIARSWTQIGGTLEDRNQFSGVDVPELFRLAGISAPTDRLGLTEIVLYLAYTPDPVLRAAYCATVLDEFERTRDMVENSVLVPLRDADGLKPDDKPKKGSLLEELTQLNETIYATAARLAMHQQSDNADRYSPLLGSIARKALPEDRSPFSPEDLQTRRAVEDFLLVWMTTAHPDSNREILSQGLENDPEKAAMYVLRERGLLDTRSPSDLPAVLRTDHVANLVRASMKVDSLLEVIMRSLDAETKLMIDEPLQEWIDRVVLTAGRKSDFGFRFGGTTRLVVTSRTVGYTGAEAVTYFPYQPTSELTLENLVKAAGQGGGNPLENPLLSAAFEQAQKPPYYRSMTPGIKFGVLPTMLPSGAGARLQVKLDVSVAASGDAAGAGSEEKPAPIDLVKSMRTETELLANSLDTTSISSLKLTTTAPGKRDWAVPILSQILPIRSWFVGPTEDQTKQHEAIVVIRVVVVPKAMDLASRFIGG